MNPLTRRNLPAVGTLAAALAISLTAASRAHAALALRQYLVTIQPSGAPSRQGTLWLSQGIAGNPADFFLNSGSATGLPGSSGAISFATNARLLGLPDRTNLATVQAYLGFPGLNAPAGSPTTLNFTARPNPSLYNYFILDSGDFFGSVLGIASRYNISSGAVSLALPENSQSVRGFVAVSGSLATLSFGGTASTYIASFSGSLGSTTSWSP